MAKIEVECCDSTHIHTKTIHQVEKHLPKRGNTDGFGGFL